MIQAALKDLREGYRQGRYPLPPLGNPEGAAREAIDVKGANTNASDSGH